MRAAYELRGRLKLLNDGTIAVTELGAPVWIIWTDLSQGMSLYVSTHRTTKTLTRYQVLLGWNEGTSLPRLDIKPVLDDVVKVQEPKFQEALSFRDLKGSVIPLVRVSLFT